jgi:hypothetical protein
MERGLPGKVTGCVLLLRTQRRLDHCRPQHRSKVDPWGFGAGLGIQAWQADGVNLPDLSGPLIRVELGWWVGGWEWVGGGGGQWGRRR